MKNQNNYGGITKLSGNRRKPYMAYKTVKQSGGEFIPPELKKRCEGLSEAIGTMSDTEAAVETAMLMYELRKSVGDNTSIKDYCKEQLTSFIRDNDFKATYKKCAIGYYATLAEAQIALAETNRDNIDVSNNPTFADIYAVAIKAIEGKSVSTRRTYASGYNHCEALHDKQIRNITIADLQSVLDRMSGMSGSSQNFAIKVCHLVFEYAVAHSVIPTDYSKYMKVKDVAEKKVKTVFSDIEIKKLKNAGYDDIVFLIYTGLRIGEYLSLDRTGDILVVHGTKNKTSDRIVPLHPALKGLHLEWIGMSYRQVEKRFKKAMSELGMCHTIHETRHTFATITKKFNLEPTLRQYILGHRSGNITDDVYTHPEAIAPELVNEVEKIAVCF